VPFGDHSPVNQGYMCLKNTVFSPDTKNLFHF
jgi:hypothetical protein